VVCGVLNTTSKDRAITTKDLNPSRSIRDCDEISRNPKIGSRVGSSANPRAITKLMLIDAKLKTRTSAATRRA